jgi:hypothetical protein
MQTVTLNNGVDTGESQFFDHHDLQFVRNLGTVRFN